MLVVTLILLILIMVLLLLPVLPPFFLSFLQVIPLFLQLLSFLISQIFPSHKSPGFKRYVNLSLFKIHYSASLRPYILEASESSCFAVVSLSMSLERVCWVFFCV